MDEEPTWHTTRSIMLYDFLAEVIQCGLWVNHAGAIFRYSWCRTARLGLAQNCLEFGKQSSMHASNVAGLVARKHLCVMYLLYLAAQLELNSLLLSVSMNAYQQT